MSTRRAFRWIIIAAALVVPLRVAFPAEAAGDVPSIPPGFRVVAHEQLGQGVDRFVLARSAPPEVVNIARMAAGAPFALRAVLSNDAVAGPEPRLERTSSMCARIHCLVAVNGDFFTPEGVPVGSAVVDGEPVRSPNRLHHQLTVDDHDRLQAGPVTWETKLVPTDLNALKIDGVNVERSPDSLVLYTPRFGPSTGTNPYGAELVLKILRGPALQLDQTAIVSIESFRFGAGNTPIPRDGLVLSGHGAEATALAALWAKVKAGAVGSEALLRVQETPFVKESIGGTPILLRDGRRWVADNGRELVHDRHPRTIVGWTKQGDVFLVTVDGRQPGYSVGMNLIEAADFMKALGASDAINMDGGGSTTFVAGGAVVNRPSDRLVRRGGVERIVKIPLAAEAVLGNVERPVVDALAIVPIGPAVSAPAFQLPVPPARTRAGRTLSLPSPAGGDPASNLEGALPAVVGPLVAQPPTRRAAIVIDLGLIFGVTGAFVRRRTIVRFVRPRR